MTSEFMLTPAERCHFAGEYERLRIRVKVAHVELTTKRIGGIFLSVATSLVLLVVKACLASVHAAPAWKMSD